MHKYQYLCVFMHTQAHPSACFLLNIVLHKHICAKEPRADLGAAGDICLEKSFQWAFPVLFTGATFGASCCLTSRSLDHCESQLNLGCWREEREKFCPHLCASALGYASPGLWAPEAVLSTWVIHSEGWQDN